MSRPNGVTIWRGPSQFNGEPVAAKLHGLYRPSSNPKTGPGQQLCLIPDRHDAVLALKDGGDAAVCGDCVFRGGEGKRRLCYVNPMYVNTLGKAEYPSELPGVATTFGLLRLGSYGSPASVPYEVSERTVAAHPGKWTGYYQEWANPEYAAFGELCMASATTARHAEQAWDLGFRTFRVLSPGEEAKKWELVCPHVTHRMTCLECGLCNGNASKGKSIVNPIHGSGKPAEAFSLVQAYVDARLEETLRVA